MALQALTNCLNEHQIRYFTIEHAPSYTAQETAHCARISGYVLAKSVILNIDGELAMVVVHAPDRLNLASLKNALGAHSLRLASEQEFKERFPQCELGAMPPFGNLFGMNVIVAMDLADKKTIVFNAGSHTELISLDYADFERIVKPRKLPVSAVH